MPNVERTRPTDSVAAYVEHWRTVHRSTPYFAPDRDWTDYAPAYRLGCHAFTQHRGKPYADVEHELEHAWHQARGDSRLSWDEARNAVRDGWHCVEPALLAMARTC